jgi:hypothetical protein
MMASRPDDWPRSRSGPPTQVAGQAEQNHSNISEANEITGSQLGSQRCQILGYVRPQSASVGAAKRHVRPHPASSGDGSSVPSKQRVAGSNPARRANRKAQVNGIMRPGIVRHSRPGTGPGTPSAQRTRAAAIRSARWAALSGWQLRVPAAPAAFSSPVLVLAGELDLNTVPRLPPNSPLRSRTPSSSCRQALDTRSGSMILNGSSQQCPRSSTMTQQRRGADRLDDRCSHRSGVSLPAYYAVSSLHGPASRGPTRSKLIGHGTIVRMTLAVPGQALTCATTRGDV